MRMLSVVDVFACCFVVVIVATARKEQNMCVRSSHCEQTVVVFKNLQLRQENVYNLAFHTKGEITG